MIFKKYVTIKLVVKRGIRRHISALVYCCAGWIKAGEQAHPISNGRKDLKCGSRKIDVREG